MSTVVITTVVTYKYLMGKNKHDLAYMVLDLIKASCQTRDAEQRNAPGEAGGEWTCTKCKTRNGDDKSICGFCDTPRLAG